METKKLKKLSINKMQYFPVIGEQEQMGLKGGDSLFGYEEYYQEYGTALPIGSGYDPESDTLYSIQFPTSGEYPDGTTSIGETDYQRWNRMNEYYGNQGGNHHGEIYQWVIGKLFGE